MIPWDSYRHDSGLCKPRASGDDPATLGVSSASMS